jgi:hypothetical protein
MPSTYHLTPTYTVSSSLWVRQVSSCSTQQIFLPMVILRKPCLASRELPYLPGALPRIRRNFQPVSLQWTHKVEAEWTHTLWVQTPPPPHLKYLGRYKVPVSDRTWLKTTDFVTNWGGSYFINLIAARIYSVEWMDGRWKTNWKRFGRKRPWPNRGIIPAFVWSRPVQRGARDILSWHPNLLWRWSEFQEKHISE